MAMEVDNVELTEPAVELSEVENDLYDRQIRLWGLESQKRLRTAKVLISGLSGLGAEVAKNVILSGVNSITLHDENIVTEEDFCSQFLVPQSALGKNRAEASIERAQALNPMVPIKADTAPLSSKDAAFFKEFDVVVILGTTSEEILRIDGICREEKVKFFSGDMWGMFGYCFADLQEHQFIEDVVKHKVISQPHEKTKVESVTSQVKRELAFPSFWSVLQFDVSDSAFLKKLKRNGPALILLKVLLKFGDKFKRHPSYKSRDEDLAELLHIRDDLSEESALPNSYFENIYAQISPAAAIVGGILAQEVIKVITKKEAPYRNVFLFDPERSCGFVETIGVN